MIKREALIDALASGWYIYGVASMPECRKDAAQMIDAYRDEVLREAVKAQKKFFGTTYSQGSDGAWYDMSKWLIGPEMSVGD